MINIKGAEKLEEITSLPASFHGSEIISILLQRDSPSVTITLLFSSYEGSKHISSWEIYLNFKDVEEIHIEAFNHQNVVSSLDFDQAQEHTESSSILMPRVHVSLDTVFGAWATFTCSDVEVDSMRASSRRTGDPTFNRPGMQMGMVHDQK